MRLGFPSGAYDFTDHETAHPFFRAESRPWKPGIDPVRPIACKVTGRSLSAGDAWRLTGRLAGLAVQARIPEFDSHDPSRSFRHHTIAVQ